MVKRFLFLTLLIFVAGSNVYAMDQQGLLSGEELVTIEDKPTGCEAKLLMLKSVFNKIKNYVTVYDCLALSVGVAGAIAIVYKLCKSKDTRELSKKLLKSSKKDFVENLKALWKKDKVLCLSFVPIVLSMIYSTFKLGKYGFNKIRRCCIKEKIINGTIDGKTCPACYEKFNTKEEKVFHIYYEHKDGEDYLYRHELPECQQEWANKYPWLDERVEFRENEENKRTFGEWLAEIRGLAT